MPPLIEAKKQRMFMCRIMADSAVWQAIILNGIYIYMDAKAEQIVKCLSSTAALLPTDVVQTRESRLLKLYLQDSRLSSYA